VDLGFIAGAVIAALVVVVVLIYRRARKGESSIAMDDAGAAIVAFGKAYPALPIRDVVLTADRETAFLRLADGRVGFVQAVGRHLLARLLAGGSVRAHESADERTLRVDFRDATVQRDRFTFASATDAAEVSLWLVEALMAEKAEIADAPRRGSDA
jgi:hypothetical protein